MEKEKVTLCVDDREDGKIFKILESNKMKEYINKLKIDVTIKRERLLVGDFNVKIGGEDIKSICIERKAFKDFISSMRKKRLYEQMLNMEENFDINYLLISGNIKDIAFDPHVHYTTNEFIGSVSAILSRFNVKPFIVNNDTQLLKLVLKIVEKNMVSKSISIIRRIPRTTKDVRVAVLSCVPKVGVEKAKKILEKYSLSDMFDITEEDLMEIDGIGDKIAENIVEIFQD